MQLDQFQRLLPTFIQVIHLTEKEEQEYRGVVSAVFEGKEVSYDPDPVPLERPTRSNADKLNSSEASINNKVSSGVLNLSNQIISLEKHNLCIRSLSRFIF